MVGTVEVTVLVPFNVQRSLLCFACPLWSCIPNSPHRKYRFSKMYISGFLGLCLLCTSLLLEFVFSIQSYNRLFAVHHLEWTPLCFSYLSQDAQGIYSSQLLPQDKRFNFLERVIHEAFSVLLRLLNCPFNPEDIFLPVFHLYTSKTFFLWNTATCKDLFCHLAIRLLFCFTIRSPPKSIPRVHRGRPARYLNEHGISLHERTLYV